MNVIKIHKWQFIMIKYHINIPDCSWSNEYEKNRMMNERNTSLIFEITEDSDTTHQYGWWFFFGIKRMRNYWYTCNTKKLLAKYTVFLVTISWRNFFQYFHVPRCNFLNGPLHWEQGNFSRIFAIKSSFLFLTNRISTMIVNSYTYYKLNSFYTSKNMSELIFTIEHNIFKFFGRVKSIMYELH